MYPGVHFSNVYDGQHMETAGLFMSRWRGKEKRGAPRSWEERQRRSPQREWAWGHLNKQVKC